MSKSKKEKRSLYNLNYILFLKFLIIGGIITEFIYIFYTVGLIFYNLCIDTQSFNLLQFTYAFIPITVLFYIVIEIKEGLFIKLLKYIKSKRVELLLFFILGCISIYSLNGLGINELIKKVNFDLIHISLIIFGMSFILILIGLSKITIYKKDNDNKSIFLDDNEIEYLEDDKLELGEQVNNFTEKVIDSFSSNSLVFGLEAPWGVGKTSFLNMCQKVWEDDEKYKNKTIVYKFKVLNYENQEELLSKFIFGLVSEIKKNVYNSNLAVLTSKYLKLLKAEFSFHGFNISFLNNDCSIEETFKKIQNEISKINRKIIIVIDDLDRLDYKSIINILKFLKYAFSMENINFVICYDIENIINKKRKKTKKEEKIIEFFEKFVDVKYSIYFDYKLLLNIFYKKNTTLVRENSDTEEIQETAIDGLKEIFSSNEFERYLPFVGNPRKLKLLVNTIELLDLSNTDLRNYDYNKPDLIHLLLIYVNYPAVFRKIYISETNGRYGFFSVVDDSDSIKNNNIYKLSDKYMKYIEKLTENQIFLLDKVFADRVKNLNIYSTGNSLASFACINGGIIENRNLEMYLHLITHMKKPEILKQLKYYENIKNKIINGKSVIESFASLEYLLKHGIDAHQMLWKSLIQIKPYEMTDNIKYNIIKYALTNITKYSSIEIEDILKNMRTTVILYMLMILEKVETKEVGSGEKDVNENITDISDWLFGTGKHKSEGIFKTLSENGVLGLIDLITIRSRLIANHTADNRTFSYQNINFALFNYNNDRPDNSIYSFDTTPLSKYIFEHVNENYIRKKIDIFNLFYNIELEELCGASYQKIQDSIEDKSIIDIKQSCNVSRFRLIRYCTSHLLDLFEFTDFMDKEYKKTNNRALLNYIFKFCFDPKSCEKAYTYFLDYILLSFSNEEDWDNYVFDINYFTKNKTAKRYLKNYWKEHKEKILDLEYDKSNRQIKAYDYTATYEKDLPEVYRKLDELFYEKNYE